MQESQGALWNVCVCVCVCVCVPLWSLEKSLPFGTWRVFCLDTHSHEQLPSAVPQGREAAWEPTLTVGVDAPAGNGRGWVPLASIAISFVSWRQLIICLSVCVLTQNGMLLVVCPDPPLFSRFYQQVLSSFSFTTSTHTCHCFHKTHANRAPATYCLGPWSGLQGDQLTSLSSPLLWLTSF